VISRLLEKTWTAALYNFCHFCEFRFKSSQRRALSTAALLCCIARIISIQTHATPWGEGASERQQRHFTLAIYLFTAMCVHSHSAGAEIKQTARRAFPRTEQLKSRTISWSLLYLVWLSLNAWDDDRDPESMSFPNSNALPHPCGPIMQNAHQDAFSWRRPHNFCCVSLWARVANVKLNSYNCRNRIKEAAA
jgi:hypothetical protein